MAKRDQESLTTVATFDSLFDASLAKGALNAIGIEAFVPEERLMRPPLDGRASLRVFQSDLQRARVQLQRLQIRLVQTGAD